VGEVEETGVGRRDGVELRGDVGVLGEDLERKERMERWVGG